MTLDQFSLFSDLQREDIENIKRYIIIKNYSKGEKIKNELSKYLLIVNRGEIKEFQNLNNKKKIIHSILRKGETFGELFIFDDSDYEIEYITMEDTELFLIETKNLFKLIRKYPKFTKNIIKNMINKLYLCYFQVELLSIYRAKEKVPIALTLLSERIKIGSKIKIENHIPFKEIGYMIRNSREVISRVMRYYYQTGGIIKEKNRLIINNDKIKNYLLKVS
jgi:CRP/FNR family transcriptional regulator/CRP/FNR family cyclic AMP-dependent transcriptional regulator